MPTIIGKQRIRKLKLQLRHYSWMKYFYIVKVHNTDFSVQETTHLNLLFLFLIYILVHIRDFYNYQFY